MSGPEISWYGKSILGSGPLAWAGLWNKRVWADSEQLFWLVFSWAKKIIFFLPFFNATFQCRSYNGFNFFFFFSPWKIEKNTQKSCSESAQTPFSHGPAQATAHSPKLISHIKKFRDQTSVQCSLICEY